MRLLHFYTIIIFIIICLSFFSYLLQLLNAMLQDDTPFGFIIIDGHGCLFAIVQGNQRTILHKFSVDLPNKHSSGGQSALRFARLRLEKRHHYLRKCAEFAKQYFINEATQLCAVKGLILAGCADFKTEL
jgi:peptide chain release factor subunit 1